MAHFNIPARTLTTFLEHEDAVLSLYDTYDPEEVTLCKTMQRSASSISAGLQKKPMRPSETNSAR